jgi:hypothetical protein
MTTYSESANVTNPAVFFLNENSTPEKILYLNV